MSYSNMELALVVSFAAAVYGLTINELPGCVLDCFQSAITSVTECPSTDYACACKSAEAVVAQGQPCVLATCGIEVAAGRLSQSQDVD